MLELLIVTFEDIVPIQEFGVSLLVSLNNNLLRIGIARMPVCILLIDERMIFRFSCIRLKINNDNSANISSIQDTR